MLPYRRFVTCLLLTAYATAAADAQFYGRQPTDRQTGSSLAAGTGSRSISGNVAGGAGGIRTGSTSPDDSGYGGAGSGTGGGATAGGMMYPRRRWQPVSKEFKDELREQVSATLNNYIQ